MLYHFSDRFHISRELNSLENARNERFTSRDTRICLYNYTNKQVSAKQLAQEACKIEIDILKEPIGKQDQYATAFGGLNLIRFHVDDSVSVDPIICKPETIKKMEKSILVFYTGRTHNANALLSEQSKNMDSSEKRKLMGEMVNLAYEMKYLLESDNLDAVGELLDKNWKLKRQMAT